jgi:hypothetical protein
LLIGVIASLPNVRGGQDAKFDVAKLSQNGRKAYGEVFNAGVFAVGPVGWGAQTSEAELALHVLLAEKEAVSALKSLINDASPEGSLYGLLGLRFVDIGAFKEEIENYKTKPGPPERESEPSSRFKTPKGHVVTQRGCIILRRPRESVVNTIEAGDYDKMFEVTAGSN